MATERKTASSLLRDARRRAGVSQRELARRADTTQSVVARIENGSTSPTFSTLTRLLAAAGFDLNVELEIAPVVDSHMMADVGRILALTPEQRLLEVANVSRFLAAARRV
jgi:predicted transcriptional regulator